MLEDMIFTSVKTASHYISIMTPVTRSGAIAPPLTVMVMMTSMKLSVPGPILPQVPFSVHCYF